MSGPALNPLANIATTTKATDIPRDSSAASGADAADTGFSRELQRQMDREAKPSDTATGSAPASSGKASNDKSTDGPATTTENDAPNADTQTPSPDMAALLGSLLPAGTNAPVVRQGDDTSKTPLTSLSSDAQPASDLALAALLAAGQRPAPTHTVTLAGEQDAAPTEEATLGLTGGLHHPNTTGLDLSGSSTGRQTQTDTAQGQNPLQAELTDATAKLAASGEAAGKHPDLTNESTPTNSFAGLHAAALANLRGESSAPATSPVPLHVATPAGSPGWPEEIGSRVSWMVGHEESHAQLTLTPPQLGKIEVSITVSGDQTSAQFVAATPATRELIEQSLPRLREILEQSGINLGQADVGTSSQSNNSGDGRRNSAWGSQRGTDDGSTSRVSAAQWIRRGDGLVDTFA